MSAREESLEMIKFDFAKNGKDTGIALNNYIGKKISYKAFQEAAGAGLVLFKRAQSAKNDPLET